MYGYTWEQLASFPGHSQILSRRHGEKLHSCEIKSGNGLGTRLENSNKSKGTRPRHSPFTHCAVRHTHTFCNLTLTRTDVQISHNFDRPFRSIYILQVHFHRPTKPDTPLVESVVSSPVPLETIQAKVCLSSWQTCLSHNNEFCRQTRQ